MLNVANIHSQLMTWLQRWEVSCHHDWAVLFYFVLVLVLELYRCTFVGTGTCMRSTGASTGTWIFSTGTTGTGTCDKVLVAKKNIFFCWRHSANRCCRSCRTSCEETEAAGQSQCMTVIILVSGRECIAVDEQISGDRWWRWWLPVLLAL